MNDAIQMAEIALDSARIAASKGDEAAADASLEQVFELGSSTQIAHARIEQALRCGPRDGGHAVELLREAGVVATSMRDCDLLLELGAAWRKLDHPLCAMRAYRQLLDRVGAPTVATSRRLPKDGEPLDARTRFFIAFAYYELGAVSFGTGSLGDAASYFEAARVLNDPNVSPFAALALARKIGARGRTAGRARNLTRTPRIEWLLREAIRYDHPEASVEAALELGRLFLRHRQLTRAHAWFTRVRDEGGNKRWAEDARAGLAAAERLDEPEPATSVAAPPPPPPESHARRVLILGAGTGGQYMYESLQLGASAHRYDVVGFLDDNYPPGVRLPNGKRVLGPLSELGCVLREEEHRPDIVWLAMPTAPPAKKRAATMVCADLGVQLQTLPTMHELVREESLVLQRRDVRPDDLLGSEIAYVDEDAGSWLRAKRVMIVGGGRPIGIELARKAADGGADCVVLVDRDDDALQVTALDLRSRRYDKVYTYQSSVVAADALVQTAVRHQCDVMFHAGSSWSGAEHDLDRQRRILRGLLALAERLPEIHCLKRFVWVSDASVALANTPTRALAAVAEAIAVSGLDDDEPLVRCAVRAPAVYTAPGSVIARLDQLAQRGSALRVPPAPATCRMAHAYRAAELILHAANLAASCEVFALDCGDDISFAELADLILRLRGVMPHEEVAIEEDASLVVDEAPRPGGIETSAEGVLSLGRVHSAPDLRACVQRMTDGEQIDVSQLVRDWGGDTPEALPTPISQRREPDAGELPVGP